MDRRLYGYHWKIARNYTTRSPREFNSRRRNIIGGKNLHRGSWGHPCESRSYATSRCDSRVIEMIREKKRRKRRELSFKNFSSDAIGIRSRFFTETLDSFRDNSHGRKWSKLCEGAPGSLIELNILQDVRDFCSCLGTKYLARLFIFPRQLGSCKSAWSLGGRVQWRSVCDSSWPLLSFFFFNGSFFCGNINGMVLTPRAPLGCWQRGGWELSRCWKNGKKRARPHGYKGEFLEARGPSTVRRCKPLGCCVGRGP